MATKDYESKKWRDHVARQPSAWSGLLLSDGNNDKCSDPHHIRVPGCNKSHNSKMPDFCCIPLTHEEHVGRHSGTRIVIAQNEVEIWARFFLEQVALGNIEVKYNV